MLKVRNDSQTINVNVAQRLDVGNGPVVWPPLVPYVPPPPVVDKALEWGVNNFLVWGTGNYLTWG